MANPTILITGGTGFAGSHLVELLLKQGQKNINVTSYKEINSFVGKILPADNIHTLDLLNQAATTKLLSKLKPDHIYHLASMSAVGSSFSQPEKVITNNTLLQVNLLESVKKACPEAKVLSVGSAEEYDVINQTNSNSSIDEQHPLGPTSPYGVSKVTQDMLALVYHRSYDLKIVRTRSFNHIGERQTQDFVVPAFAAQIVAVEKREQKSIRVGNLKAKRDFSDVKDVVKAYQLLMDQGQPGEVYNVGQGTGTSIQEILDKLCSFSKVEVKVEIDKSRFRPLDVPKIIADNEKVRKLGWQPTISLDDTLQRVLDYWRSQ